MKADLPLVVLDTGDEVVAALTDLARRQGIEGASFSGIGAVQHATIAYWNWDSKKYEHIEVDEQVEVLAINGSIARAGNEPKIHAHVVLGRRDGSTIGGHLIKATVRPTLELFLRDDGMRLTRARDATTQLWLLKL